MAWRRYTGRDNYLKSQENGLSLDGMLATGGPICGSAMGSRSFRLESVDLSRLLVSCTTERCELAGGQGVWPSLHT